MEKKDDKLSAQELKINAVFKKLIENLNTELEELDDLISSQLDKKELNAEEIKNKLKKIDDTIMNDTNFQNAMVLGKKDVENIIAALSAKVKGKLDELKEGAEIAIDGQKKEEKEKNKGEIAKIDNFSEDFSKTSEKTESRYYRARKRLEDYDKSVKIPEKTLDERETAAKSEVKKLEERISKAEKYKDLAEKKGVTPDTLESDRRNALDKLKQIEDDKKIYDNLKSITDYEEIVNEIYRKALDGDFKGKDLDDLKAKVKELRAIGKVNRKIADMIQGIENAINSGKESASGSAVKEVIDKKGHKINWRDDSIIDKAKEEGNNQIKKDLEELLKYDLFKVFPELQDALKNDDLSSIITKLHNFLEDKNLRHQLYKIKEDSGKIESLKEDKSRAEKRVTNLQKAKEQQEQLEEYKNDTTTINFLGKVTVELKDEKNHPINITTLKTEEDSPSEDEKETRNGYVNYLCEQIESEMYPKESDDKTVKDSKKKLEGYIKTKFKDERKPGILKRLLYKIVPSLEKTEIEDWIKSKLNTEFDTMINDAKAKRRFKLTPDQQKEFEKGQEEILQKQREAAKKDARTAIVKEEIDVEEALKRTEKSFDKIQQEEDDTLTL